MQRIISILKKRSCWWLTVFVAAPDCFEAMAARTAPTILVVADTPENIDFERVDADHRWAGLALTSCRKRGSDCTDARRMGSAIDPDAQDCPGGIGLSCRSMAMLALWSMQVKPSCWPKGKDDSRDAGHTMLRRNSVQVESWPERYLYGPIAVRIAPLLLDRGGWMRSGYEAFAIILTLAGCGGILDGVALDRAHSCCFLPGRLMPLLAGSISPSCVTMKADGSCERVRGFAQATAMLAMGRPCLVRYE